MKLACGLSILMICAVVSVSASQKTEDTAKALMEPVADMIDILTQIAGKTFDSSVEPKVLMDKFFCPLYGDLADMIRTSIECCSTTHRSDGMSTLFERTAAKATPLQNLMDRRDKYIACKALSRFAGAINKIKVALTNDTRNSIEEPLTAERRTSIEERLSTEKRTSSQGPTVEALTTGAARVMRLMQETIEHDLPTYPHANKSAIYDTYLCPFTSDMADTVDKVVGLLDKKPVGVQRAYAQNLHDAGSSYIEKATHGKEAISCKGKELNDLVTKLKHLQKRASISQSASAANCGTAYPAHSAVAVGAAVVIMSVVSSGGFFFF